MVGEITHAVEMNASPALRLELPDNVANWADPPAKFDHSESCGWFFMLTPASSKLRWTDTPRQCGNRISGYRDLGERYQYVSRSQI